MHAVACLDILFVGPNPEISDYGAKNCRNIFVHGTGLVVHLPLAALGLNPAVSEPHHVERRMAPTRDTEMHRPAQDGVRLADGANADAVLVFDAGSAATRPTSCQWASPPKAAGACGVGPAA